MCIICCSLTYLELKTQAGLPKLFYQRLAQLPYLNTLILYLWKEVAGFSVNEILILLANSSPSLRHVTMSTNCTVYLTYELLKSLVNSKWESFESTNFKEINNENLQVDENLKPNVHLRSLKLNFTNLKPEVAIHFLRKFPNLKVLHLRSISEKIMYNILKYQVIGNSAP